MWSGGGDDWAGSEGTSSFGKYEHNADNLALEVIGQNWSGEVVSLFPEDWEPVRVALTCHIAMDHLCQELRDACWVSSKSRSSLYHCVHSARVTSKERDLVREIKEEGAWTTGSFLSGVGLSASFEF